MLLLTKFRYVEVKRDLEIADKSVFFKDLASQMDLFRPHLPDGFRHTFLIREPSRVFVSQRKATINQFRHLIPADLEKFDMFKHDPYGALPMLWYQKQHELWKYVKENIDPNPVIIDTFDLLNQPGPILKAYLDAVGLPFSEDLLHWEAETIPKNMVRAGENVLIIFWPICLE